MKTTISAGLLVNYVPSALDVEPTLHQIRLNLGFGLFLAKLSRARLSERMGPTWTGVPDIVF